MHIPTTVEPQIVTTSMEMKTQVLKIRTLLLVPLALNKKVYSCPRYLHLISTYFISNELFIRVYVNTVCKTFH